MLLGAGLLLAQPAPPELGHSLTRLPEPYPAPGFALYIHWPFCLAKCPYCDFNSHVRDAVDQARWRAALLRENFAARKPDQRVVVLESAAGVPYDLYYKAAMATRRALALSPNMRMVAAVGPIKVNPFSLQASTKSGFSESNP